MTFDVVGCLQLVDLQVIQPTADIAIFTSLPPLPSRSNQCKDLYP